MNSICAQLVSAYRRERDLYVRVLGLVDEQCRVVESAADPGAVVGLCRQVEELMAEIAAVEKAVEPVKALWERGREDPDGRLGAVLAEVAELIEQVARTQERVQVGLCRFVQRQEERNESARRALSAGRADKLYRAG